MPELPEVETIRQDLLKLVLHKKILSVKVRDKRILKGFNPYQLIGKKIIDLKRRGKAIIIVFRPRGYLVIQLKMTGQLIYGKENKDSKLAFRLSKGEYLNYNDHRLFGKLSFISELKESNFLKGLGPEPLGVQFTTDWLVRQLGKRRTSIKALLLNQNFIAGIGNIYASEILFHAGIKPQRPAYSLEKQEIQTLRQKIIEVLNEAIKLRGTSMNTYLDASGQKGGFISRLKVYHRENESCFACQRPITRLVQNGRSSFFCRRCQN